MLLVVCNKPDRESCALSFCECLTVVEVIASRMMNGHCLQQCVLEDTLVWPVDTSNS